jgi:hypothetical protein
MFPGTLQSPPAAAPMFAAADRFPAPVMIHWKKLILWAGQ